VRAVASWFSGSSHPHGGPAQGPAASAGSSGAAAFRSPPLHQPYRLRKLELPSRLVVSVASRLVYGQADALGAPPELPRGLVLAATAYVAPEAALPPDAARLCEPEHAAAWRKGADGVRSLWQAPVAVRLAYAPAAQPRAAGASVVDVERMRDRFVRAAVLAELAGLDMLEIDAGDGGALATFLPPLEDPGFPLQVIAAVREAWPHERPIAVRLSAAPLDSASGRARLGFTRLLRDAGCDLVVIGPPDRAGGAGVSEPPPALPPELELSEAVRQDAGIPTALDADLWYADQCHTILAAGRADLCLVAAARLADAAFAAPLAAATP
jgi:anthraniloyl-CoA monooxygenase